MQQLWQQVTSLLWTIVSRPTIVDILDIAIVAFLIYKLWNHVLCGTAYFL